MSEKKSKEVRKTIEIPVYDLKSQLEYLTSICKEFDFSGDRLISLILADWICTVQQGLLQKMDMSDIFVRYLNSTVKTKKKFDKLKELLQNEKREK